MVPGDGLCMTTTLGCATGSDSGDTRRRGCLTGGRHLMVSGASTVPENSQSKIHGCLGLSSGEPGPTPGCIAQPGLHSPLHPPSAANAAPKGPPLHAPCLPRLQACDSKLASQAQSQPLVLQRLAITQISPRRRRSTTPLAAYQSSGTKPRPFRPIPSHWFSLDPSILLSYIILRICPLATYASPLPSPSPNRRHSRAIVC
jgi:hypothetical protein